METIDLLICARWVMPIEPDNRVLENHAVAVHQGKIVGVLPTAQARERFRPDEIVDRPAHVVMPGFVNAHTHTGMSLLRGLAENRPLKSWLTEKIWPLEKRWLDAEFVRDGVELAIASMVASGTTCFADQYFYPDVVAQTSSQMHMRACVGAPVAELPNVWAATENECFDKALQLMDAYRDDPLITTAFAPQGIRVTSESVLLRLKRAADEVDIPIAMHLHQSADEVATSPAERAIAKLDRLGHITPGFSAVHMTQIDESDIDTIARGGANVIACPQANLKLDAGICPIPKLLARGINVALGTASAASNNDLDMLDEMRTAALLTGSQIAPLQWLRIATLNGARCLNLADSIGSLVAGKWADIVAIDIDDVHCQPIFDPAAAVVYSASRQSVSDTWVAGRALYSNRVFTRYDAQAILTRTREWLSRMQATHE